MLHCCLEAWRVNSWSISQTRWFPWGLLMSFLAFQSWLPPFVGVANSDSPGSTRTLPQAVFGSLRVRCWRPVQGWHNAAHRQWYVFQTYGCPPLSSLCPSQVASLSNTRFHDALRYTGPPEPLVQWLTSELLAVLHTLSEYHTSVIPSSRVSWRRKDLFRLRDHAPLVPGNHPARISTAQWPSLILCALDRLQK